MRHGTEEVAFEVTHSRGKYESRNATQLAKGYLPLERLHWREEGYPYPTKTGVAMYMTENTKTLLGKNEFIN